MKPWPCVFILIFFVPASRPCSWLSHEWDTNPTKPAEWLYSFSQGNKRLRDTDGLPWPCRKKQAKKVLTSFCVWRFPSPQLSLHFVLVFALSVCVCVSSSVKRQDTSVSPPFICSFCFLSLTLQLHSKTLYACMRWHPLEGHG
ncbi:MAG: hypothetical protein JOS17DRAFT_740517 [Linnemannia elongata]|nr:MAG: hypothetical protein JOS17DRAFT_740517 [Linnemannia elongata]